LTLLSQYQEGSNVGRQGNGTVGTLTNAELWRLYWSGAGAGSSSASTDEGSLADYATISAQYTGGSGIGGITPSVYNPESDGPPVFHSGVFTGDHGSVQFVQTADTGNQGTGEGDASESDDKSRARSWWGIRGWFLGDGPIDDGESQIVQTADAGSGRDGGTRTGSWFDLSSYGRAGDWLDQDFGGGTYGAPSRFGQAWGWARGLFAVAPIAGEISDGAELISGVGPNGEKLTPGQRGATAVGAMIPFVPGGVARRALGPVTDRIDDAIEFMGDAGKAAGKNADSVDGAGRVAGDAADTGGQLAPSTPKVIRNGHLAGKTHPETGVPFDKDGFPIFQSNGNAALPKDLIGPHISDTKQFQASTRQLWDQIKDNPARQRLFTSEQLEQIKRGEAYIDGFTWHHHQDGTMMQLVDRLIHGKTGHSGGRQVTGGRP
jgi:hypothetical protein